jgi:hypothetical protein
VLNDHVRTFILLTSPFIILPTILNTRSASRSVCAQLMTETVPRRQIKGKSCVGMWPAPVHVDSGCLPGLVVERP